MKQGKESTKKFKDYQEVYSFNSGSPRWLPRGGELQKYVGQDIVKITYLGDSADGCWASVQEMVRLLGISDFNEKTMTYKLKYSPVIEKDKPLSTFKEVEEEIIPEGFSYIPSNATNSTERPEMHRFVPLSYHLRVVEEEAFWKRITGTYDTSKTLPLSEIKKLAEISKESLVTLTYARRIQATIKSPETGEFLSFRVANMKLEPMIVGNSEILTITSEYGDEFKMTVSPDMESYQVKDLGEIKLIDLGE